MYAAGGRPAGAIELPGVGTVDGFTGKQFDDETFYAFASYTTPTSIFRYDLRHGRRRPHPRAAHAN